MSRLLHPLLMLVARAIPVNEFRREEVVCHESLGGLLNHYERKAA